MKLSTSQFRGIFEVTTCQQICTEQFYIWGHLNISIGKPTWQGNEETGNEGLLNKASRCN